MLESYATDCMFTNCLKLELTCKQYISVLDTLIISGTYVLQQNDDYIHMSKSSLIDWWANN